VHSVSGDHRHNFDGDGTLVKRVARDLRAHVTECHHPKAAASDCANVLHWPMTDAPPGSRPPPSSGEHSAPPHLLVIGAACLPIRRYYNENYGRVTLSTRQQVRAGVAAIISVAVMVGMSFLLRSGANWSLDLPVNPTAAGFALVMLTYYATSAGLREHHMIIWGSLLVAGLLPVWGGADPSNIGLVLAGVATMATGIFDHRLLVRTFGSSKSLNHEDSDVGA